MTYIKWKCLNCGRINFSNDMREHLMNVCKCGSSGIDFENEYVRCLGSLIILKKYDYNFFDEIIINLIKQGFEDYFLKINGQIYIEDLKLLKIRKLEDKIIKDLK